MAHLDKCPGCFALYEVEVTQPCLHPYIGASHSCWNLYGKVLAKEYENPDYFAVHRVTVDAYAAQHIGDQSDRRARQSAHVHLIALYMLLEKMCSQDYVMSFIQNATATKRDWPRLEQRVNPSWLTVQDVFHASTRDEHKEVVINWGRSVCEAYKDMWPHLDELWHSIMGQG